MSEWTRSHDRTLAEKCEGRTVHHGNANWPDGGFAGIPSNPYDLYWVHEEPDGSGQCPVAVPHYNTDIAACLRAAEAWRLQKPDREYRQRSKHNDEPKIAQLFQQGKYITSARGDAALAWALYEAVKDA